MGSQLTRSFAWDVSHSAPTVGEVEVVVLPLLQRTSSALRAWKTRGVGTRCDCALGGAHTHTQDEGFVQPLFRFLMTPLPIHLSLL